MAKGQDLSKHQQKIVQRFYSHRDTLTLTRLQEAVSDLYLAAADPSAAKAAARKWKSVAQALDTMGVSPGVSGPVVAGRDIPALAKLVGELAASRS